MATKSQWIQKAREFAAGKKINLLSGHINDIGRMYDDNKNVDSVFNLLQERSGHSLERSDYRKLKELLK